MSPSPVLATTVEAARNMLREDIFFREEYGHVLFPVQGTEGAYLLCFVHWRFSQSIAKYKNNPELIPKAN